MKPPPLEALLMMAWLPAPAAQARGSGNGRPGGKPAAAGTLAFFTVAPGGGVKGKMGAARPVNAREVQPTSSAGLHAPPAETCTRTGSGLSASIANPTFAINQPLS